MRIIKLKARKDGMSAFSLEEVCTWWVGDDVEVIPMDIEIHVRRRR